MFYLCRWTLWLCFEIWLCAWVCACVFSFGEQQKDLQVPILLAGSEGQLNCLNCQSALPSILTLPLHLSPSHFTSNHPTSPFNIPRKLMERKVYIVNVIATYTVISVYERWLIHGEAWCMLEYIAFLYIYTHYRGSVQLYRCVFYVLCISFYVPSTVLNTINCLPHHEAILFLVWRHTGVSRNVSYLQY